jgi:hypothetical protein
VLVSLSPKVIFIKTVKTASSSTECVLEQVLLGGPGNHHQPKFFSRSGFCTARGPESATKRGKLKALDDAFFLSRQPDLWKSIGKLQRLRNHSNPDEIRRVLGERFWASSVKLVNVRNPFDLVVSQYFFRFRKSEARPSFSEFLLTWEPASVNQGITVNWDDSWKAIRFEHLEQDIDSNLQFLGFSGQVSVPHHKGEFRTREARDYRDFYNRADRRHVEREFSDWLDFFGYRF